MKKLIYILLTLSLSLNGLAQGDAGDNQRLNWFKDAKLGIFIHWGIYSVNGIDESWSFYNNLIPYDKYMQQLNGFKNVHFSQQGGQDFNFFYGNLFSSHLRAFGILGFFTTNDYFFVFVGNWIQLYVQSQRFVESKGFFECFVANRCEQCSQTYCSSSLQGVLRFAQSDWHAPFQHQSA